MTNLPEEEKKELSQTPEQLEETQPLWVEDMKIEPKLGVPTDLREEEACYNQPEEIYQRMTQPVMPRGGARTLAVGAMCACLVVVLSLIGYYIPVMSPLLAFMVPLPMVVAGLMCGLATGLVWWQQVCCWPCL